MGYWKMRKSFDICEKKWEKVRKLVESGEFEKLLQKMKEKENK